jgi:hypothetical protein
MTRNNLILEQNWGSFQRDELTVVKEPKEQPKSTTPNQTKKTSGGTIPPADLKNTINKPGKLVRSSTALNDTINPALEADLELATQQANIGDVQITYATSGHSKHVQGSKNVSRHYGGNAVDISLINGVSYGNKALFTKLGWLFVIELQKLGYKFGEGPITKSYLWQTMTGGNHYNHIHVSIKSSENYATNSEETPDVTDKTKHGGGSGRSKKKQTNKKLTKDQIKKILGTGPGPYMKQPPTAEQLKIRTQVDNAWETMLNVTTRNPNKYFWKLRSWYNDQEDAAAKHLKNEYLKTIRNKIPFSQAHPIDQYNIVVLDMIINSIYYKILQGDEYKKISNYFYFKNKKWNLQKVLFNWNYM